MILSISVAAATALCIIVSTFLPELKIKKFSFPFYPLIAFIGAALMLIFGQISLKNAFSGLFLSDKLNPVKILVLFFSMTFLSVVLDQLGFFKYLAVKVLCSNIKNQKKLFFLQYVLISLLTVFTSNDIIILTFTPFICSFCKHAKINPIPYLFAEFTAANTMSMLFIIGNPTNIFIATAFEIGFTEYLSQMFLPTLASSALSYVLLIILFSKCLNAPIEKSEEQAELKNKTLVIISLVHLCLCTILLIISNYVHIEMWIISLSFALSMLAFCVAFVKKTHCLAPSLKKLPFTLIPFVLSMFVIVLTLDYKGVTDLLENLFSQFNGKFIYGITSFLTANLINNIPMSLLYSLILNGTDQSAIYASIIGSNIGAYFTPLGALAGIMWLNIIKHYDVKFTFATFIKYGVFVSIPTLFIALLIL